MTWWQWISGMRARQHRASLLVFDPGPTYVPAVPVYDRTVFGATVPPGCRYVPLRPLPPPNISPMRTMWA